MSLLKPLTDTIGASEPAIRLLLSMLIGYPLAIIYRKLIWPLPSRLQHHVFILATGLALSAFNFGRDTQHSLIAVVVTYLMLKLFGPSRYLRIGSFVFHMVYLLAGYYYTESETYDIKWTTPHCVLVLRLIGLTFDICDTDAFKKGAKVKEMDFYGIEKTPSFLEMASYVYFPGSFLVGPQFPYRLYERFINKDFEKYTEFANAALSRYCLGIVYLAVYQLGSAFVSNSYLLSDAFNEQPYWWKLVLMGVWGKLTFYKYIAIWLLSEGIATRYGLTFNGYKEEEQEGGKKVECWSACENIIVRLFEMATEFDHYVQSFNVNTNRWVARHIYKRLIFLGNKNYSQALTLLFLAVWHGYHSGYYLTFVFEFVIIHIDRDFTAIKNRNTTLKAFFSRPELQTPIFVVQKFYTIVGLGWCIIPFAFLSFSKYWIVIRHVSYYGFVYIGMYVSARFLLLAQFPANITKPSTKAE